MRILLLGELSGIHKELQPGLARRGHSVTTAHSGDAYRKFQADVPIYTSPRNGRRQYFQWAKEILLQMAAYPKLVGFDVVQVISPKMFHWKIQPFLMPLVLRSNGVGIIINTGCSSDYNRFARTLAYSPCKDCKRFDLRSGECVFERAEEQELEHGMYRAADAVVSTAFEYYAALNEGGFSSKNHGIPLPIDTASILWRPLPVEGKVEIYYGETRHGFKGGQAIRAALERLERDFPHLVSITYTSRLSYQAYLQVLSSAHIVIDQANSYSEGMNALYAMAMGKVVLSGAEREAWNFIGTTEESAIVNITPNAEMIYASLVALIQDRAKLALRGRQSRDYVVKYHDTDVISGRYESLYMSILERRRADGLNT